ncbi:threonine/serine dehydratase [Temperatibacter marinus]|uniref:Threonine/serine dehydratase n=1 Tax=Temperatibacter marinus TaxID=1456591 RepID=A0AA52EI28_9PROT|nr:threonine/serine dehydratase [Temperatibacter marinus]WND02441.1 threonine/serine dehydratase [Temperatibacter marinus]
MTHNLAISYEDILSAATLLKGNSVQTPLLENPNLNEAMGGRILIKPECLQRTGSFKFRGAYNRLARLTDDEKERGVVAFSSGNHAQGVAYAAKLLKVPAIIVMPIDAPKLKMENTKAYGAKVITFDRYSESREAIADQISKETGAVVVPSFDDPHIMAGQGTMGLEIAQSCLDLNIVPDQVLINCGGGGLSSGSFLALVHHFSSLEGYVVEPVGYDDTKLSLETGVMQDADITQKSICDALLSPRPGKYTLEVLQHLKVKGLTVSDAEALETVAYCARELKLTGEPGGVVSLAAVLKGKIPVKDKTTVVVISGGNIDPALLEKALSNYG